MSDISKIKINYRIPKIGGVFTQVTAKFNRGSLVGLSRCLKATVSDAGILIEYD